MLLVLMGCQQSSESISSQKADTISDSGAVAVTATARADSLSHDQARNALINLVPDVKIIHVKKSVINDLWEVGFESRGKKGIVYLDESLNYIIAGNLLDARTRKNLTEESFALINKVDLSLIPYEKALLIGDKRAKHRVVVFDDVD
jgi:thiol:disulfide interchange protein DsbC